MTGDTSQVLTASELLEEVARLEPLNGPALTERRLRYLDQNLSARSSGVTNQARLYTVQDVALVRLFLRLSRNVPAWQARAVLALRSRELRKALEGGVPLSLVVDWPDVRLVPTPEAGRYDVRVSLRSVLSGVETAIARRREATPNVWAGWMSMPASVAVRELREMRPALAFA